jgi:ribosomal protein S18 acetylase RimI-like enzyme
LSSDSDNNSPTNADSGVRLAEPSDAKVVGELLHDFNVEYDEPTPRAEAIADRIRELLGGDDFLVLLAGSGPNGLAVLRFRPSIYSPALECYLAELYVQPAHRGRGLGRALMAATIEAARSRGADYIGLATSEDDVAARTLYERFGFTNRERPPDGPVMYFYEREP